MIVTIDNLTGAGPVDYTATVCQKSGSVKPLTIERTLNASSRITGLLDLSPNPGSPTLSAPLRRARVVVTSAAGVTLFTGYLATDPVPVYAGAGLAGPVYRTSIAAVSDEWLLDKQSLTLTGPGFSTPAGSLLTTLTYRTAPGLLNTSAVAPCEPVGVFLPEPTEPWSSNAGAIARSTYAAYRVLSGVLSLTPVGSNTHTLNAESGTGDGSIQPASLTTSVLKELSNDVTVSGDIEPSAYITELFAGDGTTTVFKLSDPPFRPTHSALLVDRFGAGDFNTQLWKVVDPGSHFSLGAGGLNFSGGNGYDGQTTFTAIDAMELGGSLVVEAASLQLSPASAGVLLGLYSGSIQPSNCFVGLNVRQSGGNTILSPFVQGAEVGTSTVITPGHAYTLRIRLHSIESQRVLQEYYTRVDGTITGFGGASVAAPMAIVIEIVDQGNAPSTPATILYDGDAVTSPATCTFVAVNSVQLIGSLGSVTITQNGSAWIVSTLPGGATQTRLIGAAGEGVDCKLTTTGEITFFAGRTPVPNERLTVLYRTQNRAVARIADPVSIASEAAAGISGTARWLGKVVKPAARCTEDCEAAAQAILAFASSRSAAISGTVQLVNPVADLWPGDVLNILAAGQTLSVVVRTVKIEDGNAAPELLIYSAAFANDWSEALGIALSESIAADAVLPPSANISGEVLTNLQQLTVASATSSALQIDSGAAPPAGGGFEVRLRDFDFGPGVDQNLVLRSPVRSFSIPRTAQAERYYVRMYDASTPPLYSRRSSAVFTNLPFGS